MNKIKTGKTKSKFILLIFLFSSVLFFLLSVSSVLAANCGDDTALCSCGDTVITNLSLNSSHPITQGYCNGTGLYIGANDLTINCDGFRVHGNGTTTEDAGRAFSGPTANGFNQTTIKNCLISNFTEVISSISNSQNLYFFNNTIHNLTDYSGQSNWNPIRFDDGANLTISNNEIYNIGAKNSAANINLINIFIDSFNVTNITIENNYIHDLTNNLTVIAIQTTSSPLTYTQNVTIKNNNISDIAASTGETSIIGFTNNGQILNITIKDNNFTNIKSASGEDVSGIDAGGSGTVENLVVDGNEFEDMNVTNNDNLNGIIFSDFTSLGTNEIKNNNFTDFFSTGSSSNTLLIDLGGKGNFTISSNTVKDVRGGTASAGSIVGGAQFFTATSLGDNVLVTNNTISNISAAFAIVASGTQYKVNITKNTVFNITYGVALSGETIGTSYVGSNLFFEDNNITDCSYGMDIGNTSQNNIFLNNNITNCDISFNEPDAPSGYNNNLTYSNSNGAIYWFLSNMTINKSIGHDHNLFIGSNIAAVNSSVEFDNLNTTANISLSGLSFSTVDIIYRDSSYQTSDVTSTGTDCVGSTCTIISEDGSSVFFNVSQFSSFSAGETPAAIPEFSDFAVVLVLAVVVGGFFVVRRNREN